MTEIVIKRLLEDNTKKILAELEKSKVELRKAIDFSEKNLLQKITELNIKIKTIEEENKDLKQKVEDLEKKNRINNLVISGLKKPRNGLLTPGFICDEINGRLNSDLKETEIKNLYFLGKSDAAPIKIELVSFFAKQAVLKQVKKLKGSGVFIANDATPQQRENYRNLKPYLVQFRASNKYKNCFISNNKLI